MKNLKKFNENWIDDESEDTNRRMAELDSNDGNEENQYDNDTDKLLTDVTNDIIDTINKHKSEIDRLLEPENINGFLGLVFDAIKDNFGLDED
jgi:hypothetical protein